MLAVCFIISLLHVTQQNQDLLAPSPQRDDHMMIQCVINILERYFPSQKDFTYVNINSENDNLLRAIYTTMHFSVISRKPIQQMFVPNQGYVILSPNVDTFCNYFDYLVREPWWNPYVRFLIIIESLQYIELTQVFDVLLRQHVNNVLIVNGTEDAHLYTYNPFDNYACGRYYDTIFSYGLCEQATHDLYPNKLANGLKNCTFRGSLIHRAPFTIDPAENEYRNKLPGLEQVLIKMVSEAEGFKFDLDFNYDGLNYSRVEPNMTVSGPMSMLQKNETDVIFSGIMITPYYAEVFSFLSGYHDYVEDLKFAVKKALFVPNWKYFYLEFDATVWFLLLICLILYSVILIFLLRPKDKGEVVLELLDNLLLHSRDIPSFVTVKCVILMWVWFAYLVNTFYQSNLVSLTTNPLREYQIANEDDIAKYNLRPCIGRIASYVYTEQSKKENYERTKVNHPNCESIIGAVHHVSENSNMYTIIPSHLYMYNKKSFNDKYGEPLIYYFEKPFEKLLFVYYFYKGFPISSRFRINMMRMRENGFAQKNMEDQYYMQSIKYTFSTKEYEYRFVFPWCIYIAGCFVAILCFFVEFMVKYFKWGRFRDNVILLNGSVP